MPVETVTTLVDFVLPSLGSDMEEGTVIEWLVVEGDAVHKGDILLRVDTEKSDIDVEIWHDAVIAEILVGPGDTIPVGTALARLETGPDGDMTPPKFVADAQPPQVEPPEVERSRAEANKSHPLEPGGRDDSTPRVRTGSAETAEVLADPRLVFWPAAAVQQSPASRMPESAPDGVPTARPRASRAERRQGAVAELMERSNHEIPHFHVTREIDVTDALAWLDGYNAAVEPPSRLLRAAMLLYAVTRAARRVPVVNGSYVDGPIDAEHVDLAVAVHVRGGGLITPVLPASEALPIDMLMAELQAMVGRARAGRMSTRDMTPATLTVTNLGDGGADLVLGVIRPPQRALVGFGRVNERPALVAGAVTARSMLGVTLSADHRVVNGHAGARFLDAVADILANPDEFASDQPPTEEPHDD